MTRAQAEDFFDAYAEAFSRGDVDAVTRMWSFPAFISGPNRSACFESANTFAANTRALCAFYRAQGVAAARKSVADLDVLFDDVARVRTRDELSDADGGEVANWEHEYLLRRAGETWKVFAAVADDELAAWVRRGTPLGSSQEGRS